MHLPEINIVVLLYHIFLKNAIVGVALLKFVISLMQSLVSSNKKDIRTVEKCKLSSLVGSQVKRRSDS